MEPSLIKSVSEMSAVGGLVLVFIILVWKGLPLFLKSREESESKFLSCLEEFDKRHITAYDQLNQTIAKNTAVTKETLLFLKNLNGKLKKTIKEKINDQTS